jgi:hypothetical protein
MVWCVGVDWFQVESGVMDVDEGQVEKDLSCQLISKSTS